MNDVNRIKVVYNEIDSNLVIKDYNLQSDDGY